MADIKVLTKYTPKITAGKKYRARTAPADKFSLLAEVWAHRTDHRHITNAAKTYLAFAAVNFTFARTKNAWIHTFPQLLNDLAIGI